MKNKVQSSCPTIISTSLFALIHGVARARRRGDGSRKLVARVGVILRAQ